MTFCAKYAGDVWKGAIRAMEVDMGIFCSDNYLLLVIRMRIASVGRSYGIGMRVWVAIEWGVTRS